MITEEEVRKLAELARLELTESEIKEFQKDFGTILEYVSQVQEVATDEVNPEVSVPHNVMREDKDPYKSGEYTRKIVEQFPDKEGDYLKVKKIISQD